MPNRVDAEKWAKEALKGRRELYSCVDGLLSNVHF